MADASDSGNSQPASRGYHHGNLRAALVAAAVDLAREGGPDAIVLREVTRRAGVTPRAAYRHVADRDALVVEVARVALDAMAGEISRRIAAIQDALGRLDRARAALRAIGEAYIDTALAEPGLFTTALFGLDDMVEARPSDREGTVDDGAASDTGTVARAASDTGTDTRAASDTEADGRTPAGPAKPDPVHPTHRSPYEALETVLRDFVELGALPTERAGVAAAMCWSTVHGFATLATQGPLRELPRDEAGALGARVVEMLVAGLVPETVPVPGDPD